MSAFIHDYCKVYPKHLGEDICDELIAMFKWKPDLHIRYDDDGFPNMTQMNFSRHKLIHPTLHQHLVERAFDGIERYRKEVPETRFWPKNFSFEEFRIKHYSDGRDHPYRQSIDRFDEHIDSNDLISGKRFMIFFWYLNRPESGGNTCITNINLHYEPAKGKLLMFPPFWMYPHAGEAVLRGDKYLLSSYMHYSE